MKNIDGYLIETHPDLFEKLKGLIDCLDEVISCESEVKKLKEHPIKEWYQYLYSDIYYDTINMAQLMMNDKEITELFDDFKNSKNIKLKKLVSMTKSLSDEIVECYVESEFKMSYQKKYTSTSKNIDRNEMRNIRFLKNF
jgi:hypothetical protein